VTPPDPAAAPTQETADAGSSGRRRFRRLIPVTAAIVVVGLGLLGYQAWQGTKRVDLEDAAIRAPQVNLPARAGGELKQVYASVGDDVRALAPVARVGNEVISADVPGTIVSIRDDIGANIAPGTVVAGLIDRDDLRAVGLVDEDGGLSDLRLGQRATIALDAFPDRTFTGYVEEISRRPSDQAVNFAISDRDEARQYEVKVRLDGSPDFELRQGLSATVEVTK
jgi:multidrug resistance efflux pump